jgi:NhaP-type Na+/H+ or K+/H+ antiporter
MAIAHCLLFEGEPLMFIVGFGAICFGLTLGWITYRILRVTASPPWLSYLIPMLGIIGGAVALAFFSNDVLFGWYSIGLVIGFLAYLAVGLILNGTQELQPWRLEQAPPTATTATRSDAQTES